MKQENGKRSLEGLRIFPYVAWGLTAGFALFVYNIATELQDVTDQLQIQTAAIEEKINRNDSEADFDSYAEQRLNLNQE